VLVLDGDRAKLTDFGVATIRDESRVTMTGLIVGSPSYMAPEQATGGDITPATDLWALGALLYFTVEGEPPFLAGTALATATAVVHGEPRAHEHPGPLAPIIARLLTKDPASRPSAGTVRATLSRVGEARRSSVAPVEPPAPVVSAPPADPAATPESTAVHPGPAASPATPAPHDAPPAPGGDRPTRRRTGPAPRVPAGALAILAVVVLIVGALALRGIGDEGGGGDSADDGSPATTATINDADADAATSPSTTAPPSTTVPEVALPTGWSSYADPAGTYTIGHPPGWEVQPVAANRTDFRDPATGRFVRVEWTDTPGADAAGAWRDAEPGFRSRNANYEPLGITEVAYRDYSAALWEFRHGSGETLHTGNLGFIAAGRGYALMLRTPEAQWAASQPVFEQFKQAFRPT